MANITPDLEKERVKICKLAKEAGLDCFDTVFELVTYEHLNEIAAKGGFPVRYPHWRFGMSYEQLSKKYEYGLSKIYELVINNDPCYAYLMEGNEFLDQKLVMAHVYGHCDFFKNNYWFSQTDRNMIDTTANHSTRIRRYIDRHGLDVVEDFIDKCLSIENLIDRYSPYANQKNHAMKQENQRLFPPEPEKDVLEFLMLYAPLESWQQDIISIIRAESYYFAPQGMTKIMNEGWASYWHSKLMTEKIMNDSEIIEFADRHSGTMAMAPNGFNPYKVGIELFRDIERRWNKGQHGREWSECKDLADKKAWDTKANKGREKIFEVRKTHNDLTFIDEFLTESFCVENKFFVYKFNKHTNQFEVDTRDFPTIKKKLLFQLSNLGQPMISVVDANFENKGELFLTHFFEGIDLQPDYMTATLENIQKIWKRPVNLATVMDGESRIFKYDGKEHQCTAFSETNKSDSSTSDSNNKGESA